MKQLPVAARRLLAMALVGVFLTSATGCSRGKPTTASPSDATRAGTAPAVARSTDPGSGATAAGRSFPAEAAFDYQLGGAYKPAAGVRTVVRDRTARPASGSYSICYINAFQTQPRERSTWPKSVLLRRNGHTVMDPEWPDEALLDTSTAAKRTIIQDVVSTWIRGCAKAGFRAVEFDNLDSFTRSHGILSFADNRALARAIVADTHAEGLAAGQKNAAEYAGRLRGDAGFDFAVAEECAAYRECRDYSRAYGAAVMDIEYTDNLPRRFTAMCADSDTPSAMILRDRDLLVRGKKGYVYRACG